MNTTQSIPEWLNKSLTERTSLLLQLHNMNTRVLLEITTSRTGEETPEAMMQLLASFIDLKRMIIPGIKQGIALSLELAVIQQHIHCFISIPKDYQTFVESQILANYPKALIAQADDYLPQLLKDEQNISLGQLKLAHGSLYPLRTFKEFKEIDSMTALLGLLAKAEPQDMIVVQLLLVPTGKTWQDHGQQTAQAKTTNATGTSQSNPHSTAIKEKVAMDGFKTALRIAVGSTSEKRSRQLVQQVAHSFSTVSNPSGNRLILRRPYLWQKQRLLSAMLKRSRHFMPQQILNIEELATVYHFPTQSVATIPHLSWHKTILSEPPSDLAISDSENDEGSNFFAECEFKNRQVTFGIKSDDRRRHMYIIGKTGVGKSTLIANMAISDIRAGKGICVIDPHGDLCETLLDYIPSHRINDVVYLNPADDTHSFTLNPLETTDPSQQELVVSGIVAIFHKLYGNSWGPRLEYILRNTLLTAIKLPQPTMLVIPRLLTDDAFRANALMHVTDPVLLSFWNDEFANMQPRLRSEAISPILNKVGQFISSRFVRNILQEYKSTINLQKIMDEGKIVLLHLPQGKLGEDNAALLGAMIITKLQLAAMQRVTIHESERKDFYLYVDEFQNFATSSFIKILSEARKYRLNLILANQYIAQVPEDVRAAIFGNAGTMLSFLVGADDATFMTKEFKERFKEEDLLALNKHEAILKMAIDGMTQAPFLCKTLPLPNNKNQNRANVIKQSYRNYYRKITD